LSEAEKEFLRQKEASFDPPADEDICPYVVVDRRLIGI